MTYQIIREYNDAQRFNRAVLSTHATHAEALAALKTRAANTTPLAWQTYAITITPDRIEMQPTDSLTQFYIRETA